MTDRIMLTINPEPGQQACLWVSSEDDRSSLGIACCSMASRCKLHSCSRALHGAFQDWLSGLERAPLLAHPRECLHIDWQDFHREGRAPASRLKHEVGGAFRVIYAKPLQDPAWRRSERRGAR